MSVVGEDSISLVVDAPVEPDTTVSVLRGCVGNALHGLGEDHLYDVLLVVTELVANVLDHASGVGQVRVFRSWIPCEVWVEVDDLSSHQPVYGRSRLGEYRGRGLVVVGNVAREWGIRLHPSGGKTVYALIRCADHS